VVIPQWHVSSSHRQILQTWIRMSAWVSWHFVWLTTPQVKAKPFSFNSAVKLQQLVELLPSPPEWHSTDIEPESGESLSELTLFWRDPIECVQHLLDDPRLANNMNFVPRKVYADKNKKDRIYHEMWTGNWWWRMQVCSCDRPMERCYLDLCQG